MDEKLQRTDTTIEGLLSGHLLGEPFAWPFHTKSEPHRRIRILTDRQDMAPDRRARLMRLATLRSVDACFHKVRSNIRFAARPAHTPSGNGRAWDRHYLYNPETMVKIIETYRIRARLDRFIEDEGDAGDETRPRPRQDASHRVLRVENGTAADLSAAAPRNAKGWPVEGALSANSFSLPDGPT